MIRRIGLSVGLNGVIVALWWFISGERELLPALFLLLVAFDLLKWRAASAAPHEDRDQGADVRAAGERERPTG